MEEIINNFKYKQMNKKEEQVEEQGTLIVEKTDEPIISVDDVISKGESEKKKRDTSFVDERKKQIELYGNYYPAGLSDEGIIEWANLEITANEGLNANLKNLKDATLTKMESEVNEKLAAFANSLSPEAKEKLKSIIG